MCLFQVNAAVGCLARMPLPHAAFKPPVQHPTSGSSRGQRQQGLERSASRFGSELWAPYLRDTALRVFGSVGVAGQLGHFCRPVLDFTAGTLPVPFLLCMGATSLCTHAFQSRCQLAIT